MTVNVLKGQTVPAFVLVDMYFAPREKVLPKHPRIADYANVCRRRPSARPDISLALHDT
jgi:hypothetical protein